MTQIHIQNSFGDYTHKLSVTADELWEVVRGALVDAGHGYIKLQVRDGKYAVYSYEILRQSVITITT